MRVAPRKHGAQAPAHGALCPTGTRPLSAHHAACCWLSGGWGEVTGPQCAVKWAESFHTHSDKFFRKQIDTLIYVVKVEYINGN